MSLAISIAGIAAFVTFLIGYRMRVDPMKKLVRISPFHYAREMELVVGGALEPRDIAVLAGITIACVAIACVAIFRRDL